MNFVKRLFCVFLITVFSISIYAVEMEIGFDISSIGVTDDGGFTKNGVPDFGFNYTISGAFTEMVSATFTMERIPFIGNILKPRLIFSTTNMSFEIGPSISVLNYVKAGTKNTVGIIQHGFASPIQPGFGIGMGLNLENGFFALFDIDFSLATGISTTTVYLNNGRFEVGFRSGQTIFSLSVDQYTRTVQQEKNLDKYTLTSSQTNIAFNFEVFSKGSPFRFPFSCNYRIFNFEANDNGQTIFTTGVLGLTAGLTHQIYNDISWYFLTEIDFLSITFRATNANPTLTAAYSIKGGVRFGL